VTERRGIRPSEALGITCDWCGYCVDEGFYVASGLRAREKAREDEAEVERQDEVARMRREMRAG
jgi:hypothetical protein